MDMDFETVRKMVIDSLELLKSRDSEYFEEEIDERTVTAKLACYLQGKFIGWNVDCEYNRIDKGKKIKTMEGIKIKPDIIIHKRREKNNLLAIEAKKDNNSNDIKKDKERLKDFTEFGNDFEYKFGLFLLIKLKDSPYRFKLTWYEKGKELPKIRFEGNKI